MWPFEKKYVFETKTTRLRRQIKGSFFFFLFLFVFYLISGPLLYIYSEKMQEESKTSLFQKSPDLIVVFTGAKGRLPMALKMANKFNVNDIFITGVHSANSIQTIFPNSKNSKDSKFNLMSIDYEARNTYENVLFTLKHLNEKKQVNSRILIISHDYHLPRIKFLFKLLQKDQYHLNPKVFYFGVKSTGFNFIDLRLWYTEVFKLLRSFGLVFLI